MPIWKVSHTDGTYQVADADGVLYPLTTGGQPLTRFNEGWSPRGLQTGLPPLHVLELEHTSGDSTIWLHDEALDYRANAVLGLSLTDQSQFFAVLDQTVRTVYAECVLAPQAAIPSVAHQFDGMLPRTVALLTAEAIRRTMPATDVVVLDRLQELEAGYGNGTEALAADWIARAIEAPSGTAQERFDLDGRRCDRHVDPDTALVFYVTRGDDPAETSVFVPQRKVVFVRSRHAYDPLALLINYYASHTDRAVALPEALDLAPDMVVPPQHGLDEPPLPEEPVVAPRHEAEHDVDGHETGRTVFEAPLSESTYGQHDQVVEPAERGPSTPAHEPDPIGAQGAGWHEPDTGLHEPPPVSDRAPPAPQSWWQRLLGLGNP